MPSARFVRSPSQSPQVVEAGSASPKVIQNGFRAEVLGFERQAAEDLFSGTVNPMRVAVILMYAAVESVD